MRNRSQKRCALSSSAADFSHTHLIGSVPVANHIHSEGSDLGLLVRDHGGGDWGEEGR